MTEGTIGLCLSRRGRVLCEKSAGIFDELQQREGYPFKLYNVTAENFAQLEAWFPGTFDLEYDRDDQADYVYESGKLATLAGKTLHGKRNHINKFKTLYPDSAMNH